MKNQSPQPLGATPSATPGREPVSGVVRCRPSSFPPPSSLPPPSFFPRASSFPPPSSAGPRRGEGERYAHRVEPLPGMEQLLDRMNDDVRRARRRIWVGTYIYREGRIGHYFAGMFASAARRGLDVRVLYDALGSQHMPRWFVDRMRAHGIDCRPYRPLRRVLRDGSPFPREHSRTLLFDDAGYVGGAAWSDEWLPRAWGGEGWREVCCRVEGPAVDTMEDSFSMRWRSAGGEQGLERDRTPSGPPQDVAFVADTPRPPSVIYDAYRRRVRAARHRVWIANAYFCPPRAIEADLREAAARGVDVRVITPGSTHDLPAIRRAALARYDRWLGGGLRLFEYEAAMFHAKYAVVDDDWATVGTLNLNATSMRWANEANLVVRQRPFVQRLASLFEEDLRSCREVRPGERRAGPIELALGRLYGLGLDALDLSRPGPVGLLSAAPSSDAHPGLTRQL
jgi:cardiolipin synthase A/B